MSRCPHCGIEHGMAPGTGDCGCEEDFDIGMGVPDPIAGAESRRRAEESHKRRMASPMTKAIIELEGPGVSGLGDAETMLFMAGWPPERGGPTSGEYTDSVLRVKAKWRIA